MCKYEYWLWKCGFAMARYPKDENGNPIKQDCINFQGTISPQDCSLATCVKRFTFNDHCFRCKIGSRFLDWVCTKCGDLNDANVEHCLRVVATVTVEISTKRKIGASPEDKEIVWERQALEAYTECDGQKPTRQRITNLVNPDSLGGFTSEKHECRCYGSAVSKDGEWIDIEEELEEKKLCCNAGM